ncbi:MAG: hypothetical protein WDO73_27295 [Ignavibacteriota bacterium]
MASPPGFNPTIFVWLGVNLDGHGLHDLLRALFAPGSAGHIRPWSERLIFILNYNLFGLNPLPFRLLVFAIQFANLALVVWIGTRLTGHRAAGSIAALAWALNAVTVDPLAWAAANNQVQVAFFLLLAFYFLLRYIDSGEARFYLYQWIAFLLGFGALEINIVYPSAGDGLRGSLRAQISVADAAAIPRFRRVSPVACPRCAARQRSRIRAALYRRHVSHVREILGHGRSARWVSGRRSLCLPG